MPPHSAVTAAYAAWRRRLARLALASVALAYTAGAQISGGAGSEVEIDSAPVYPACDGTSALADGWFDYSWNGQYDFNSTADVNGGIQAFRGSSSIRAQPNLYGALSLFTTTPFAGAPAARTVEGATPS